MLNDADKLLAAAERLTVNDPIRLRLLRAEARRQAAYAEGDFVEAGVFRGGTALLLAHALMEQGSPHRLHLLDSWQGMPEPRPEDAGALVGQGYFGNASEVGVRSALSQFGLLDRCQTYAGWFENTLPALPGPFGFAHIDCDFYEPIKFCLLHLMPRMSPRGTILVDDFGDGGRASFPGVAQAVHEVVAGTGWRVLPLGGVRDQSVLLLRTAMHSELTLDLMTLI